MKFPYKLSKERLSLLSEEDRRIYEYEHSGLWAVLNDLHKRTINKIVNTHGDVVPECCPKCGGEVYVNADLEPMFLCAGCNAFFGFVPRSVYESLSEEVDEDELTYEDIKTLELSDEYDELEKKHIQLMYDELLFETEFDGLFDKELKEALGAEEYNNVKKEIFEFINSDINNDPEMHALFEAEGRDAFYWIPNVGWLGKLAGGLLTGLLGLIAWLLMKGKDRLAMKKLKQYMNKLVELTDQGVNKKKPWYSFLMPTKKKRLNTGEYSKACFRTIQESAERNMACLYSKTVHDLGYLSPGTKSFKNIISGSLPQEGSGLNAFYKLITELNNDVSKKDDDKTAKVARVIKQMIPTIEPDDMYNKIKLPDLPSNYSMLMSPIDYPDKAKKNPNGSLMMKPTEEIFLSGNQDLGLTYFGNPLSDKYFKNIIVTKKETNESFYNFNNSYLEALNELLLTNDLDNEVLGKEINLHTLDTEESKVTHYEGDLLGAIDGYITRSVSMIEPLIRSVCGNDATADIKKLAKIVHTSNLSVTTTIDKYLKNNSEFLKNTLQSSSALIQKNLQERISYIIKCLKLLNYLYKYPNEFKQNSGIQDVNKFEKDILELVEDPTAEPRDFKVIWQKYGIDDYNKFIKDFEALEAKKKGGQKKPGANTLRTPTALNASYNISYNTNIQLNEDFDDDDDSTENAVASADTKLSLDEFEKMYVKINENLKGEITQVMSNALISNPEDWLVIKDSKDRMNKLKEAADKEINAKIELICRTASSASSDMGGKFAAALSKHPVRAESLKNIWARYSDDLSDRISQRIKNIYGGTGKPNMLLPIRALLENTYPALIAFLMTYKLVFYLIKEYTSTHPIEEPENDDEVQEAFDSADMQILKIKLSALNRKIASAQLS